MQTEDNKKELTPIQEKRELLKRLSKAAAAFVENGEYPTINEAIINTAYKSDIHKNFKTFNQWKAAGFFVQKGEKAFLVWGRPTEEQETEKGAEPSTEAEGRFFPLAFLFSNAQVEQKGGKQNV
jgi:hypothetical protein